MEENESKNLSNVARQRSENPSSSELFVSKTPGNSSSGYANTFRILENQIRRKQLRLSSLCSISEEDPSLLELELAAQTRLSELCDTNVFKSESSISLNKQLDKFSNVQNYIYFVAKSRNGASILKPKHLSPPSSSPMDGDYGKLTFSYCRAIIKTLQVVNVSAASMSRLVANICSRRKHSDFPFSPMLLNVFMAHGKH